MGAVAWTIFNILLLILIIYAWFRVLAVLRRQIGVGLAGLFLLSLAAFKGSSDSQTASENLIAPSARPAELGNWSNQTYTQLNPFNKLFFRVEGKKEQGVVKPLNFHVTTSGLLLGHEWKPIMGTATWSSPNVYYHVVVLHDWKLLGIKLYTSMEEHYGHIPGKRARRS